MPAQSVASVRTYPSPCPVEEQCAILRNAWPRLNPDGAMRFMRDRYPDLKRQLPGWVEGPFLIPHPGIYHAGHLDMLGEILSKLAAVDGLGAQIACKGSTMERFRENPLLTEAWRKLLVQQQGSCIIVVFAQFGQFHCGEAVPQVLHGLSWTNFGREVPLGPCEVGSMLLTNSGRLASDDTLRIDCPGASVSPLGGIALSQTPTFSSWDGSIIFDVCIGTASEDSGSATAFVFSA